ncbi:MULTISPECIES: hypothetical protein [Methylobacteriaceae]
MTRPAGFAAALAALVPAAASAQVAPGQALQQKPSFAFCEALGKPEN